MINRPGEETAGAEHNHNPVPSFHLSLSPTSETTVQLHRLALSSAPAPTNPAKTVVVRDPMLLAYNQSGGSLSSEPVPDLCFSLEIPAEACFSFSLTSRMSRYLCTFIRKDALKERLNIGNVYMSTVTEYLCFKYFPPLLVNARVT